MLIRLQRRRTKGFHLPPGTVCVTRPSAFGNPFRGPPAEAVELYRQYLGRHPELVERAKRELRGKNLACYCRLSAPCHADVLLEIANV